MLGIIVILFISWLLLFFIEKKSILALGFLPVIKRLKQFLISAIAFGIYHWFSYGVLGNVMAMVLVFIGTGLMGYAWAWAFTKTKSIMLPFGMHLGWNFVYNSIFSKGPVGELLLISEGGKAVN